MLSVEPKLLKCSANGRCAIVALKILTNSAFVLNFLFFFVLFANNGLLLEMREAIPYRMIDGRRII